MTTQCITCRFFLCAGGEDHGECRRYPPTIVSAILAADISGQWQDGGEPIRAYDKLSEMELNFASRFPRVHCHDSACGEHSAIEP